MLPGWLIWLGVVGLAALAALVVGPSRGRRIGAWALAGGSLFLSLAASPDPPLLATLCSLFSILAPFKVLQLSTDARAWPAPFRVWHTLSPFDARETKPATGRGEGRAFAALASYTALGLLGVAIVVWAESRSGPTHWVVRWLGGALGVYCGTSALASLVIIGHRLAGVTVRPLHRAPIVSRSVSEFWGQRWNRPVHAWLREFWFVPCARRGHARLGVLAAFVASAAIHVWIVLVSVGSWGAAAMAAFFCLQAVFVILESRLVVRRWPAAAGHAWTLGTFVVSAPLFLEPFLRSLGL